MSAFSLDISYTFNFHFSTLTTIEIKEINQTTSIQDSEKVSWKQE